MEINCDTFILYRVIRINVRRLHGRIYLKEIAQRNHYEGMFMHVSSVTRQLGR